MDADTENFEQESAQRSPYRIRRAEGAPNKCVPAMQKSRPC